MSFHTTVAQKEGLLGRERSVSIAQTDTSFLRRALAVLLILVAEYMLLGGKFSENALLLNYFLVSVLQPELGLVLIVSTELLEYSPLAFIALRPSPSLNAPELYVLMGVCLSVLIADGRARTLAVKHVRQVVTLKVAALSLLPFVIAAISLFINALLDDHDTLVMLYRLVRGPLSIVIVSSICFSRYRSVKRFGAVLFVVAALMSVIVLVNNHGAWTALGGAYLRLADGQGRMLDPIETGRLAGVAAWFGLFLYIWYPSAWVRILAVAGGGVGFFTAILSNQAGPALSLLLVSIWIAFTATRCRANRKPLDVMRTILILSGAALILFVSIRVLDEYGSKLAGERMLHSLRTGRIQTWGDAFDVWLAYPLLGVGLGGFGVFSSISYPHNIFVDILVSGGLIGVIATIPLIHMSIRGWRLPVAGDDPDLLVAKALLLYGLLNASVSGSLFSNNLLLIGVAMLGISYYLRNGDRSLWDATSGWELRSA